jgi:hypothetical protein
MAQPGTPPTPSDGEIVVYSVAYGGLLVVPGASLDASGNASVASCNAASTETTRAEAAEALLAPKANPTFTGTVTLPSGVTLVAPVLGTPASGTLTNCTFPTLNQNTTGTAGGLSGTPAITVGAVTCTSVTGSATVQGATVTSTGGLNAGTTKFAVNSSGVATEYNSIALTGNGIPSEVGIVTTGTATAAIAATNLLAAPVAAGLYRVSCYLKITVATTSPVAGAVTLTYADKDGVAQSVVMSMKNAAGAVATQTGSTTTTPISGDAIIWCNSGTAIKYAIAFSGTGTYEYNFKVEAL